MLCFPSEHPDRDRDEAKDELSADDSEAMDIGDVELKAEASILAKEVKYVLVTITTLLELNQAFKAFYSVSAPKGGRNDRRRKSSPEG